MTQRNDVIHQSSALQICSEALSHLYIHHKSVQVPYR